MKLTLDTLNLIPRPRSVLVSPDGRTLTLVVQTLDENRFTTSLWELPSDGSGPAGPIDSRLASPRFASPRFASPRFDGLRSPAFLDDGSFVFVAPSQAGPDAMDVIVIPHGRGDPRSVLTVPGGIDSMVVAPHSGTVVVKAWMFPRAENLTDDASRARRRADAAATAILFEELETRRTDRELGPRLPRLLRFDIDSPDSVVDLVPSAGGALVGTEQAISADGRTVVTTLWHPAPKGFRHSQLLAIDSNGTRVIADDGQFARPAVSPDGRWVAAEKLHPGIPSRAERMSLWLVDLTTGEGRDLTGDSQLWPEEPFWAPDSRSVYFVADDHGRAPVFNVALGSGEIQQVAGEGTYTSACASPDGNSVFAIRHTYRDVPRLVRVDAMPGSRGSTSHAFTDLSLPELAESVELEGRASEITWRSADGTEIHGHLVVPESASPEAPAPLVLWIHGQTRGWNAHNFWQWCPYVLTARGYAVLMANPARSTGYGQRMMQRGWGYWGDRVLEDLESGVDAVITRPDIDERRLAAMGHSFGGHMANWLAGRTDRFKAIINCAGVWAFDQFQGTTDKPVHWEEEFGDPYTDPIAWVRNSPRLDLGSIRTPMLIAYGLQDYSVPISEGLRLWIDLKRHDVPAKFLLFPDEDHSLSRRPSDVTVLYQTVLAFLDHHVLDKPWELPELLG